MVEFVVKMKGRWWRMVGPRKQEEALGSFSVGGCRKQGRRRRENERERGVFILREWNYYKIAIFSKQKRRTNGDLHLHLMKPASRQQKLDAEINAASKKRKTQDRVKEETKRHG